MIDWYEDLELGMRFKSGTIEVTEADIKAFASRFDPQPFHLDEKAAQNSIFNGLAASGWHTAALAMSLVVKLRPFGHHPLVGLGVDELRWTLPVRPGDIVYLEGEVKSLVRSRTKPQGIVVVKWIMKNQNDDAVYTFTPTVFVPTRPD